MFEKVTIIKNEVKKHPKKYPALAQIIKHKEEIKKLINQAVKEMKVMVKENPDKFPFAQEMFIRIDMWKSKHLKR